MRTKFAVTIFLSLLAGAHIGSASAQGAGTPSLTEAEIKPCEDLLAKSLALEIRRAKANIQDYGPGGSKQERVSQDKLTSAREKLEKYSGISILQFALKAPPYTPSYDTVKNVQYYIKEWKEVVAALESGSAERMSRKIGVSYSGQEFEERLAWDKKFLCMLNVRLAQLKGGQPAAKPVAAKAAQPAPKAAAGNAAPSNAPSAPTAPAGGLSAQQIAACSEDIRRKQLESQSWPGNVNIVAARLGQFQKDLFEGRCAGHPEAQAYLAGANKMLGYGGSAAAGGSQANADVNKGSSAGNPAPLRGDTKSTESNPTHNTTKSKYVHPETGRDCVTPTNGPQDSEAYGKFYFQNICARPFAILMRFTNGVSRENGVGSGSPGRPSKTNVNCERRKNECSGAKWEVR